MNNIERYIPCPFCNMKFESDKILIKHIKTQYRRGHGNTKCSNCKQPLSKCADIDAVGQSFKCKPPKKGTNDGK